VTRPDPIAARSIVAALLLGTACLSPAVAQQPAAAPLTEAQRDALWESRGCVDDERGSWFRDAKFGAIIHFGVYSQLGGHYQGKPYRPAEQIMGLGDRRAVIPPATYKSEVAANFNPTKFDAAEWVRLMKAAGQKYVILTTKHHDGFCMFKTATTPFNVIEATPFKRDIVREVADECRKQGLEFSVYFSIGDWSANEVMNPKFDSYKEYMHAQLKELLTNYGDIKLLWFDNWWYVDNQWKNDDEHAKDLYTFSRSINPGMLVNDRCGVGVKSDHGDYATPENQLKGSLQSRYFEVVMTNTADDHWGWVRGATNYRPAAELIRNLVDSVSKGGNFVLNVGPTDTGEFPPEHVATLETIGAWTTANAEAIYATIPAPEVRVAEVADATVYATQSKDRTSVYLHIVSWPADGSPVVVQIDRPDAASPALLDPTRGRTSFELTHTDTSTSVSIARPSKPDPAATVVKLRFRH
jgi:alpha-L-fucosidase